MALLILSSILPRKDCIFTIDPSTARDLDDALSCKPLADGRLEISIPFWVAGCLHAFLITLAAAYSPNNIMCRVGFALFLGLRRIGLKRLCSCGDSDEGENKKGPLTGTLRASAAAEELLPGLGSSGSWSWVSCVQEKSP